MRNARLLYPGSAPIPESLRDVEEAITPVAADVVNPAGDTVINVGNAAAEIVPAAAPVADDWAPETIDGTERAVYTNESLANRVRVGDTVTIDIDGTEYTKTVYDVNTLTGQVYFTDNASPSVAEIEAGASITVSTDASEATFSGRADRIARYNQTEVASPSDTAISTRVVYIEDTVYENASFTADTNTLYLIWKT